jgi:K+-transporting ATPase ATPase B chain
LFDSALIGPAVVDAFKNSTPHVAQPRDVRGLRGQHHHDPAGHPGPEWPGRAPFGFIVAIAVWLWFTVLFANFAEALAEGRSKAQAAAARPEADVMAKKLQTPSTAPPGCPRRHRCARA